MPLTIATWNVNSIRARKERLFLWLARVSPDVVCLQETKVVDEDFPKDEIEAAGYRSAIAGQKTYNGVAILSRHALSDVTVGLDDPALDKESRFIAATVSGLRVASAYVPNGKVVGSDKYAFKLAWLDRLRRRLDDVEGRDGNLVLGGDFNVAPEDADVAFIDDWRESVLCHDAARGAFQAVLAHGLTDTVRHFHAEPGIYTWWDYQNLGFPRNDGLRIDHILVSNALTGRCRAAQVDRDTRKASAGPKETKPSDHAPVILEIDG